MEHKTLVVLLLAASGSLCACAPTTAIVHGQIVQRPTLGYTDHRFFAVKHELAYPEPRGPSSGLWSYGGRIVGDVCGTSVNYESDYYGRFLDVSGYLSSSYNAGSLEAVRATRFEVRDSKNGRTILGSTGSAYFPIELNLRPDSITGVIGQRHYDLTELDSEHNELRGTVRLVTWLGERTYPFVLHGVRELWDMPAADQAVLMPIMFSCLRDEMGTRGMRPVLTVDFSRTSASR